MTRYHVDWDIALALLKRGWFETLGNGFPLRRLAASGDPVDMALARAVDRTRTKKLTFEEKAEFEILTRIRRDMRASDATLTYMDYGAGTNVEEAVGEAKDLGVERTARLGTLAKVASGPLRQMLFEFNLVRALKPKSVLELGAFVGLSATAMGMALRLNGPEGRLVTLEGAKPFAEQAQKNFERCGLSNVEVRQGRFIETLPEALEAAAPIDLAIVDGHHKKEPTLEYFERILPFMAKDGVMLFDDVVWNQGMREAWRAIRDDARCRTSVDLLRMGVVVIGDNPPKRKPVTMFAA